MTLPDCDPPIAREELVRWRRRILGLALVAAIVILAAAWMGRQLPLRSPGRIAIALLQGAASTALIVATARPMRHYDELQRRIQLEALGLAYAATAILATTYGFLVKAGLPDIDWGSWIWPAMTGLWAIAFAIACRRYR
jgi:Kef-type K+ transport system membrane component KefB